MFIIERAGYQNVIQINESEIKFTKKSIHKSLKRLCSIFYPKGIQRNSHSQKGVTIADLGTESAAVGV